MEEFFSESEDVAVIIQKHKDTVYKLAFAYMNNSYDAEDIYQEVFIRYLKNKPNFQNEEHEKAWFIRVTINCCKSLLMSSWMKKTVGLEHLKETCQIEFKEDELLHLVMELPIKYKEVIHLYYYEDYSVNDIAKILKRSKTAVTTQLGRGRTMIKARLEGGQYETKS